MVSKGSKSKSKASATAAAHAASRKKSSLLEISATAEAQIRKALQARAHLRAAQRARAGRRQTCRMYLLVCTASCTRHHEEPVHFA